MASDSSLDTNLNKPFDYSLRVSRRAKRAKIQVKPYGGLEVVIPLRFPKKAVPGLVQQHAAWISRQLQKQKIRFPDPGLPGHIHLAISGVSTRVVYAENPDLDDAGNFLLISDGGFDERVLRLRQWVRNQAWKLLPPLLDETSQKIGLSYKKASIRSQKTRWGSCSTSGTISLNDQLLFVPRETAEYLMVHELCHTRHPNHSSRFWALVENHLPDYRRHERVLDQAKNLIPDWFLKDLYR